MSIYSNGIMKMGEGHPAGSGKACESFADKTLKHLKRASSEISANTVNL